MFTDWPQCHHSRVYLTTADINSNDPPASEASTPATALLIYLSDMLDVSKLRLDENNPGNRLWESSQSGVEDQTTCDVWSWTGLFQLQET